MFRRVPDLYLILYRRNVCQETQALEKVELNGWTIPLCRKLFEAICQICSSSNTNSDRILQMCQKLFKLFAKLQIDFDDTL